MTMIERVARAIYAAEGNTRAEPPDCTPRPMTLDDEAADDRETYFIYARAAIEAMREPTEAMERAAVVSWENYNGLAIAYTAMIDAALEETP